MCIVFSFLLPTFGSGGSVYPLTLLNVSFIIFNSSICVQSLIFGYPLDKQSGRSVPFSLVELVNSDVLPVPRYVIFDILIFFPPCLRKALRVF